MTVLLSKEVGDITTTTWHDPLTEKVIVKREQDCKPIIESVKKLKQEWDGRGKEYYHAGRIPVVVVEKFCREKGMDFATFLQSGFKQLLNDPDYKGLRIWEGRV